MTSSTPPVWPWREGREAGLTWKWKQFTVCEGGRAGLSLTWLSLCVLMTQEDFVVPIIVSSLICRHLFVQSLLCYNLFLIYSHQPSRSLSALFINIKPHQSWKETEILYKLYLFDDKSTASLTFATQNIGEFAG